MKESETTLGKLIDLSLEDFKRELEEQKPSLGIISNLFFTLSGVYTDLTNRKEVIVQGILRGTFSKEDKLVVSSLEGLYSEMTKIEQKMLYLRELTGELTRKLTKGN